MQPSMILAEALLRLKHEAIKTFVSKMIFNNFSLISIHYRATNHT